MNKEKIRRLLPICMFTIFIFLFIYIGYIYNEYRNNLQRIEENNQHFNDLEWIFIKSIIYEDYLAAGNQAKIVAEHITTYLKRDYPDLDVLKEELEHPELYNDPKYFKIFKSSINGIYLFGVENEDNGIFICDRRGILINLSLSAGITKFPYEWNDFFNSQENPLLAAKAVELIFQQSNGLIFWEKTNSIEPTITSSMPMPMPMSKIISLSEEQRIAIEMCV